MRKARNIIGQLLGMVLLVVFAVNFNACSSPSPVALSETDENGNAIEQHGDPVNWPPLDQQHYDDDDE